jgi:hypothetical protein
MDFFVRIAWIKIINTYEPIPPVYGLFKFLILKYYFNRIQILRIDGYI